MPKDLDAQEILDLMYAAVKYEIEPLRHYCSGLIIGKLDSDTAPEILLCGLRYHEQKLIKVASEYLAKNLKDCLLSLHECAVRNPNDKLMTTVQNVLKHPSKFVRTEKYV